MKTTSSPTPSINRTYGAGRWFPADSDELRKMVEQYIDQAKTSAVTDRVVAGIAPHAGYVYSGPVVGHVFRVMRDQAAAGMAPDTVIILGFSHSSSFNGAAVMAGDTMATPLGQTELDRDAGAQLTEGCDRIFFDSRPHQGEHSAENLIPFAQAALPKAKLLPIIIGDHAPRTRTALVNGLLKIAASKKITVIASSDMLHDPDYDKVSQTDRVTLEKVKTMQSADLLKDWTPEHQIFCGISAVVTALEFASQQGCKQGTILYYRNSGDDHPESRGQWVVGYGAVVFPGTQ